MPWTCLVPGCDSNKSKRFNNNISTFKVPDKETDEELYEKWLAAIPGCSVLKKNNRICEKHFRNGHIIKEYVTRTETGEFISINHYKHPRLVKGAVPSIFSKSGEKLDSCIYREHAYVTKPPNSFDENPNPREDPYKITMQPESNDSDKCKIHRDKINDSCVNNLEIIINKQRSDCHCMRSSYSCNVDKVAKLLEDATTEKSTLDKTVINSNRLSKLDNDQVLSDSASITAIFQSVTFDFYGNVNNPNKRIKLIIDLVKPWNAARAIFGDEEYLILSHMVEVVVSGKKNHTLEKAVLISKDRKITYEIYGRPCDVDHCKLPNFLENVTKLTEILRRFKDLSICEGVKIFKTNYLTAQAVTFHEQPWRPDDCTLISTNGDRCPRCQKQTNILSTLNNTKVNKTKLASILLQSNPLIKKKLCTMQNKTEYRARLRTKLNVF